MSHWSSNLTYVCKILGSITWTSINKYIKEWERITKHKESKKRPNNKYVTARL